MCSGASHARRVRERSTARPERPATGTGGTTAQSPGPTNDARESIPAPRKDSSAPRKTGKGSEQTDAQKGNPKRPLANEEKLRETHMRTRWCHFAPRPGNAAVQAPSTAAGSAAGGALLGRSGPLSGPAGVPSSLPCSEPRLPGALGPFRGVPRPSPPHPTRLVRVTCCGLWNRGYGTSAGPRAGPCTASHPELPPPIRRSCPGQTQAPGKRGGVAGGRSEPTPRPGCPCSRTCDPPPTAHLWQRCRPRLAALR